jgi:hypothetical protein
VQPALTSDGDILISADGTSGTRRLAIAGGPGGWTAEERWTSSGLKPYFNDLVIHKGHAYGFDARILSCIDLKDGKRIWKGGRYGNGQCLLPTRPPGPLGRATARQRDPDQFTELAKVPLEAKPGTTRAVGDTLLVRNGQEVAFLTSFAAKPFTAPCLSKTRDAVAPRAAGSATLAISPSPIAPGLLIVR